MSKVVVSLPKGMVKNSVIGGVLALAAYVLTQFLWALLIDRGLLGFESLYPLVCVSAGAASLLGCGYSLLRGTSRTALSVPVVVVVFLTLTLAAAFLTADAVSLGGGLTGVGLSMAAGGLLAALIGGRLPKQKRGRGKRKPRRTKRS